MSELSPEDVAKLAKTGTQGEWELKGYRSYRELVIGGNVQMCDQTYYPWCPDAIEDWQRIANVPAMERLIAKQAKALEGLEANLSESKALLAKAVEALQDAKRLKDEALKVACQLPRHSIAKHDLQLAADLFELKEEAIQELTGGKDE